MEINKRREECEKIYHCRYCGKGITWWFDSWHYYKPPTGLKAKDALDRHEKDCEKNPNSKENRLHRDIARCKTQARISECLNCKHYQKKCDGIEK